MIAPNRADVDILTRTTLHIDGNLSPPSSDRVVHALHRVPGVLLAEIDAVDARAVVAHDSAVSTASLLEAVAGAGARATVLTGRRAADVSAGTQPSFAGIPIQRLMLLVAALVPLQVLLGAANASLAKTHSIFPLVLSFFWAFVLFSVSLRRRT